MNENTIRKLVDALGAAVEAKAAGGAIDNASVDLALTNAVTEALVSILRTTNLGHNEDFKRSVREAIRGDLPRF